MTMTNTPDDPSQAPASNRRAKLILHGFGYVVAIAAGVAIGYGVAGTDAEEPSAESTSSTSTESERESTTEDDPASTPVAEPEPEPEPTQTGPQVFAVGEPGSYSEGGVAIGSITVESFDTSTEAPGEYRDPPANGRYLTVTISASALDGELYDVNPFDFYVRDAEGNRWDQTSGNAHQATGDNDLSAVTLNGGETVRGTVSFDVPAEANQIVYAPGRRALGVWELS